MLAISVWLAIRDAIAQRRRVIAACRCSDAAGDARARAGCSRSHQRGDVSQSLARPGSRTCTQEVR